MNFDLNSAIYLNGMWIDNNGNRITESEYYQMLSASTWNDLDPEDLIIEEDDRDHDNDLGIRADQDFREYVMGINL